MAVKLSSRPLPFLGTPSPDSWQCEKGWPLPPLGEPPFCPFPGTLGATQEGASRALHELPIRVVGRMLRVVAGHGRSISRGDISVASIQAPGSPWRKGVTQPCALNHSVDLGRSRCHPCQHCQTPLSSTLAPASPKPGSLRAVDVSSTRPLPQSLGQHSQQEASLGKSCFCAWCPFLVSLACCSEPLCPGHQHSVRALPSDCSPPHRAQFYFFSLFLEFGLQVDYSSKTCTHPPHALG